MECVFEGAYRVSNWALLQEKLTGLPVAKRARHAIHFQKSDNEFIANISGKPCHYLDNGLWKPIDTAPLLLGDGTFGCAHSPVRIGVDGSVTVGSGYSQRARLFSAKNIKVDGDHLIREFTGGEQQLVGCRLLPGTDVRFRFFEGREQGFDIRQGEFADGRLLGFGFIHLLNDVFRDEVLFYRPVPESGETDGVIEDGFVGDGLDAEKVLHVVVGDGANVWVAFEKGAELAKGVGVIRERVCAEVPGARGREKRRRW